MQPGADTAGQSALWKVETMVALGLIMLISPLLIDMSYVGIIAALIGFALVIAGSFGYTDHTGYHSHL